jgi:hypothetical protein
MSDIELSQQAKSLKLGEYEHYKGKRYKVLGVALHSETLKELVIYKALYGQGLTWVRPLDMFFEDIEVNGRKQKRFRFLKD